MKIYNNHLSKAFDSFRKSTDTGLPNWLRKSENRLKKKPDFDLDYDISDAEYLENKNLLAENSIRQEVMGGSMFQTEGHEALAYYKPYSFSSALDLHGWGIHFRVDAILRYAMELLPEFKRANSALTYGQVTYFIMQMIRMHEIDHACAELAGALDQIVSGSKTPAYIETKGSIERSRFSEIVAMQREMFSGEVKSRKLNQQQIRFLIPCWQSQVLPKNYSDWLTVSSNEAENNLLKIIAPTLQASEFFKIRHDVGLNTNNKYVLIPTYYWANDLGTNSFGVKELRLVFDCKKLRRFLYRQNRRSPFGIEIRIEESSDHDLKVVSDRTDRPIKFACHAWRETPEFVINQLAMAFGANSKKIFIKYLVANL